MTYFFVWLGPPRSILPSRPPTEAIGSFFLACGGLVFIFSTEEVTLAAMRRGRDGGFIFVNLVKCGANHTPRCYDVPECCGCYNLPSFLLDPSCRRFQGMDEIQAAQWSDL